MFDKYALLVFQLLYLRFYLVLLLIGALKLFLQFLVHFKELCLELFVQFTEVRNLLVVLVYLVLKL